MSRYIDADALKDYFCGACATPKRYQRTFEDCRNKTDTYGNSCFKMRLIDTTPTADVVEVVRCKDCAYYREETSYCLNPHCSSSYYGHRVREHHYCSYGERREK